MGIFQDILKRLDSFDSKPKIAETPRPRADIRIPSYRGKVEIPKWNIPAAELYELYKKSDVTRLTLININNEVFRRGYEVKSSFQSKCTENACGKEFNFKTEVCDVCTSQTRNPTFLPQKWEQFFKTKCNNLHGGQNLLDVLKEIEDDLNIFDNAFAVLRKTYFFDANGRIVSAEIKEFQRGNPINIQLVRKPSGELGGLFTCALHRENVQESEGRCKTCNAVLYKVEFAHFADSGNEKPFYYIEGEVLHLTRYTPTTDYGHPPLLTIYQQIMTDLSINKYTMEAYALQRSPSQLVVFHTSNYDAIEKAFQTWETLSMARPNEVIPMLLPKSADGNKDDITTVDLAKNLPNLEELRSAIRSQIASFYGVSPIMMGDTSTGQGLHNESMQITVSNRRVAANQATYNEKLLPWLLTKCALYDFKIELLPSEEKDEAAELQRELMKVQIAQAMLAMGFKPSRNDKGEFEYSKTPELPVQQPIGQSPPLLTSGEVRQSGSPEKNFGDYRNFSEVVKSFPSSKTAELEKELDKAIAAEVASFKGKPTKVKLQTIAGRLSLSIPTVARKITEEKLKQFYAEQLTSIAKRSLTAQSENNLNSIFGSNVFTESYAGLSDDLSKSFNEILAKSFSEPNKFSLADITSEMRKQALDISQTRLNTIARTEVHNVALLAREEAYETINPDVKVKWLNPVDSRTTPICKKIVERTKNGVTLEELRKIIKEEADPKTYRADRPYSPHVSCRSIWS